MRHYVNARILMDLVKPSEFAFGQTDFPPNPSGKSFCGASPFEGKVWPTRGLHGESLLVLDTGPVQLLIHPPSWAGTGNNAASMRCGSFCLSSNPSNLILSIIF